MNSTDQTQEKWVQSIW